MRGSIWCLVFAAALYFPLVSVSRAQAPGKSLKLLRTKYGEDTPPLSPTAASDQSAREDFKKAVEVIEKGNEAMKKGDEDGAYCAFEEGVTRLDGIRMEYPGWEKKRVSQQLANVNEVKNKLNAATCKSLEQMKEGQFRAFLKQRLAIMNKKLNILVERLDYLEKQYWDQDDQYIKDIRDQMLDIRH
jgi:hypothetical protein